MIDDSIPEDHRALWMGLIMTALVMGGIYAAYNGDLNAVRKELATMQSSAAQSYAQKHSRSATMNIQPASIGEVAAPYLVIPRAIFQLNLPTPELLR